MKFTKFLLAALLLPVTLFAEKPTFVLVHGALFTSQGWAKTQRGLQEQGLNVVTLDVPGRLADGLDPKTIDLARATRKVCDVVALQPGKVILVGHSQGGALITQAQTDCPDKIAGLVYLAAVMPLDGETAFQGLDPKRDTGFGQCATPAPSAGIFRLKTDGPLAELFMQDASDADKHAAVPTMVSEPIGIGTTVAHIDESRLRRVNKYYIETTKDRIVSIKTQRRLQARINWNKVYSLPTGHSPFLSQPAKLVEILAEIAR